MLVCFLIKLVEGLSKNGTLIHITTVNIIILLGMVHSSIPVIANTLGMVHSFVPVIVNTSGMVHSFSPVMSVLLILLIETPLILITIDIVSAYIIAGIDFNSGNVIVYKSVIPDRIRNI